MMPILPPGVVAYLECHHVMTLCTSGGAGPWAAAVFYVNDGYTLFFLSSPATRHCRNLAQDARCAATIHDDTGDWASVKGIQLEGRASKIGGDEARRARLRYGAKFPIVGGLAGAPAAIVEALSKVHWYRLDADRMYFVDNSRGFGHREEIELVRG